jgi:hypothetical protein
VRDEDEGDAGVALQVRNSSRIACRSFRSRAESGSSSSSTSASGASARARATRCFCPPESCAGLRVAIARHVHAFQHLADAVFRACLLPAEIFEPIGDILFHRHVREERVALEDGVDVPFVRRDVDDRATVEQDRAAVWASKPAIILSSVVLPQPDGPSIVKNSLVPMSNVTDFSAW